MSLVSCTVQHTCTWFSPFWTEAVSMLSSHIIKGHIVMCLPRHQHAFLMKTLPTVFQTSIHPSIHSPIHLFSLRRFPSTYTTSPALLGEYRGIPRPFERHCSPKCPGPPPGRTCHPWEAPRRLSKQMAEPPKQVPLYVEQLQLYRTLFPVDQAPYTMSVSPMCPGACPFSDDHR